MAVSPEPLGIRLVLYAIPSKRYSYRIQKKSFKTSNPKAWLRRSRRNLNPGAHPTRRCAAHPSLRSPKQASPFSRLNKRLSAVGENTALAKQASPFREAVSPSATRITSSGISCTKGLMASGGLPCNGPLWALFILSRRQNHRGSMKSCRCVKQQTSTGGLLAV